MLLELNVVKWPVKCCQELKYVYRELCVAENAADPRVTLTDGTPVSDLSLIHI